jgi:murein DD-endopeptidase MepM/ murein hydrolase activator NlpD
VLLDCDGGQVLLAHLMEGSVRVAAGEALRTGQPIARVGNSGRSTEPHLHLHAQARSAGASFGSDPLPIRVNGQVLVRGSRMRPPGPAGGPEDP